VVSRGGLIVDDIGRDGSSKAKRWTVDEDAGELYFRYFEVRNPETPVVIFVEKPWDDAGHEEEDRRLKEWVEQLAKHLESMPLPATWPDKS
jgi:hypothetical protein